MGWVSRTQGATLVMCKTLVTHRDKLCTGLFQGRSRVVPPLPYRVPADSRECAVLKGTLNVSAMTVEYIDHGQSMDTCRQTGTSVTHRTTAQPCRVAIQPVHSGFSMVHHHCPERHSIKHILTRTGDRPIRNEDRIGRHARTAAQPPAHALWQERSQSSCLGHRRPRCQMQ